MISIAYLLTSKWHEVEGELLLILGMIDIMIVAIISLALMGVE
jgi:hypothetical protein